MNKLEWLAQLVQFDTTSRNSNLDLIHCIKDALATHKIESTLIQAANQPKANLFATIPAHNGQKDGGLILSGHTDVVPVDGQQWDTNPFQATTIDNKIFGRGTSDMKGFIAVVLSLVPEFVKLKLEKPIHFAFSYDEEIGCLGAPFMIKDIQDRNIKPAACIVGEPTEMRPVVAHKGKHSFRCSVHGKGAHSSLTPQGCNAIEYAARIICFLRDMADKYKSQGPFDQYYDVPFTTLTTNLIKGGNSQNTIPELCEFVFEFRHIAEDDPKQLRKEIDNYITDVLLPKMRSEHPAANIVLDKLGAGPNYSVSEEEDIAKLVRKLTQVNDIIKVAYGTEAALFQAAQIPTILCGPGSIEQAHRPNEYVAIDQLEKCEQFVREVVKENNLR